MYLLPSNIDHEATFMRDPRLDDKDKDEKKDKEEAQPLAKEIAESFIK